MPGSEAIHAHASPPTHPPPPHLKSGDTGVSPQAAPSLTDWGTPRPLCQAQSRGCHWYWWKNPGAPPTPLRPQRQALVPQTCFFCLLLHPRHIHPSVHPHNLYATDPQPAPTDSSNRNLHATDTHSRSHPTTKEDEETAASLLHACMFDWLTASGGGGGCWQPALHSSLLLLLCCSHCD